MNVEEQKKALCRFAAKWSKDPLEFARKAFPWGEGTLADMKGPDKWQTAFLSDVRDQLKAGKDIGCVIRQAVAAGHGVGKSGCVAWVILWALSTFPDTRGVVTANTDTQLRTKTWAELAKWFNLCLFRDWFTLSATSIVSKEEGHDKTWRIDAIPWSETNPEAFAGLHNQGKRILVIFDEASAIADIIWEVIEGAMTDKNTQIMWFCYGNPTRSSGRFFECFNRFRDNWHTQHVDGRDSAITNKELLEQYILDYGIDSNFVKVRVLGQFPDSSDMQFISRKLAEGAKANPLPPIPYTKVVGVIGVDVARFGNDTSVLRLRLGQDARSYPARKFHGLDGWQLGAKVAEFYNEIMQAGVSKIMINLDAGGVGASVQDWLTKNGYPVNPINFGEGADDDAVYANKRAEMWGRTKDWLKGGGCIDDDDELITDLTGVEYDFTPKKNQIILEKKSDMKKRGLASPDNADALALTFAVRFNEYMLDMPRPYSDHDSRRRQVRDPYRR